MRGYFYGAPMTVEERSAYNDGFRSGQADRLLNRISDYARVSFAGEPLYTRYYSAGYNYGRFAEIVNSEID